MSRRKSTWYISAVMVCSLFAPAVSRATDYYVDAAAGSDSNSGRGTTAWRTVGKVNSSSFAPGDRILFKRGQTWREQLIVPSSGSAGNPIVFGAYGSGSRPVIKGSALVTGWTSAGGNVWRASLGSTPNQVFFNGTRGTKVSGTSSVNGSLRWYWTSGTLYVYAGSDPDNGTTIEASVRPSTRSYGIVHIQNRSYVTIQSLDVSQSASFGLYIKPSGQYITADDCDVHDSLDGGLVAASSGGTAASHLTVLNCLVHHNNGGYMEGDPGVATYHEGLTMENVDGFTIRGTRVYQNYMEGSNFKRGARNGVIEYCDLYANALINQYIEGATNIQVRYNRIYDCTYNAGIEMGLETNSYSNDGIRIYGNLFWGNSGGVSFWSANVSAQTRNIQIYNNTFYNNWEAVRWKSGATDNYSGTNSIKDNLFWQSSTSNRAIWDYTSGQQAISRTTIAYNAFQQGAATATTGSNARVITDPYFVGASSRDFHLRSGSPCIDTGTNVGLTTDMDGTSIPQGSAPDIGADEYASGGTTTTYTLTTSASHGTISRSPDQTSYPSGQTVTLTATADSGYTFSGWSGSLSGTTNPATLVMDANKSVTANFTAVTTATYTLTTSATNGTITRAPNQTSYASGQTVTLTATANSGYTFSGWSGDLTGTTNPATLVMNANKSVTANFTSSGSTGGSGGTLKTVGNTTVLSGSTTIANRRAAPYTMAEAGQLQSISIYHDAGSGQMLLAVYGDSGGKPGSRLGVTSSTTVSGTAGWQTVALPSPVSVSAGQKIWLAWVFEKNPGIRATAGTPGRAESSATWSGGMPTTFGTSTVADYIYSIYASYSPVSSGGGTGTTLKQVGNTTVCSMVNKDPNRRAAPYTMAEAGQLQSISIYHDAGSGQMLLAVYGDSSGKPGSRLGVTSSTTVSGTAGWQTVALPSPVSVSAGQKIWLAWVFQSNPGVRGDPGTPGRASSTATWSGGMPTTFGTSTVLNYIYSIYANYSPVSSGGGTGTTLKQVGNTTVCSMVNKDPNRRAAPYTMAEAGQLQSISIYHDAGSGQMLLAVYGDSSGKPGSRLGVTSSTTVSGTAGWQTVALPSPVSVSAGQKIWLAWVFQSNPGVRGDPGTPGRASSTATWSGGMPTTFGTSTVLNYIYSIYANYSPVSSGGGTGTTLKQVGNTTVLSGSTTIANRRAAPYTMPEAGQLQSISLYHNAGSGQMLLAVYADSSGKPGSRLGVTSSTTVSGTTGWQTVALPSPVSLSAGQKFWLAWVFQNNPGIRAVDGTPGRAESPATWSGGMPTTFGASTVANYIYSIYANYSPGSTTAAAVAPSLAFAATTATNEATAATAEGNTLTWPGTQAVLDASVRLLTGAGNLPAPVNKPTVEKPAQAEAAPPTPAPPGEAAPGLSSAAGDVSLPAVQAGLPQGRPATATDGQGNTWVVWHAGAVGQRQVYAAKLAGDTPTWSQPVQISQGPGDHCEPALAIDADGTLYVAWQQGTDQSWSVRLSQSAEGATWSAPQALADAHDDQVHPSVAAGPQPGNPVAVVWQQGPAGRQDIFVAQSSDQFASVTVTPVTADEQDQTEPVTGVDGRGTIYVLWTDARNGARDIYGAASSEGSWRNVPLTAGTSNHTQPALAVGASGVLYLAWVDDLGGDPDIFYAASAGLPSRPVPASDVVEDPSRSVQEAPAVTVARVAERERVYVGWQDSRERVRTGGTRLYLVDVSAGSAAVNVPVDAGRAGGDQKEMALGSGPEGRPYVVWTQDGGESPQIRYGSATGVDSAPEKK